MIQRDENKKGGVIMKVIRQKILECKEKETKSLIIFCVAYCTINIILTVLAFHTEGFAIALYVTVYYPVFWIISGILLIYMIKRLKIKIHSNGRLLLVLFSTPLPFIVFFVIWATW